MGVEGLHPGPGTTPAGDAGTQLTGHLRHQVADIGGLRALILRFCPAGRAEARLKNELRVVANQYAREGKIQDAVDLLATFGAVR